MEINEYIIKVNGRFKSGVATEHSYRGDLQQLLESLIKDVQVTNEPKRINCGAPDYILTRKQVPIGYIEAKDIGKNLDDKSYKEQFDRYRNSLPNLIITDYLDYWFYRDSKRVATVRIAEIQGNSIKPISSNFKTFNDLIHDFATIPARTITSSSKLAIMMADKAKLMTNVLGNALDEDIANDTNTDLHQQLRAFQSILIHDIKPREFADIYSQTIAYGLFAARLHDTTLEDFSRKEAAELIPKSNPFLRKLFHSIAGPDLDERIDWIVDALADIFRAADVAGLLKEFGKTTQRNDPFLHFYETFLAEYDPKKRKSRGVWYTPEPIVSFIVRAVDDILKLEFGLNGGLADTSKTTIKIRTDKPDRRTKSGYAELEKQVHRVQILDPATGTGTFLAEVIKQIYHKYKGQEGVWKYYVERELIPRLNGFEILMASYAMAHMKLELLLKETGYTTNTNQRLQVYLTNSLEEHHPDTGTLFASWLSNEASEANHVKRDTPIMVVLGNPPYSVSSSNKGEWIQGLISSYKEGLNERKLNLDDDYIKFIRYGQYIVEKNNEGILAFITNNSFIDGITHRQMRRNLVETFDKIYIVDLHGSTKKQETAPDGSADRNVFDIQQGVSINIFVKKNAKSPKKPADIFHAELYGDRNKKYQYLWKNRLSDIQFTEIELTKPMWFFVPKDYTQLNDYEKGFSVNELFIISNTGIQTKRDRLVYHFSQAELNNVITDIQLLVTEEFRQKYKLPADGRDWSINWARDDLESSIKKYIEVSYRPFDIRHTVFTGNSKGFMAYPRSPAINHTLNENITFLTIRNSRRGNVNCYFVTKYAPDKDAISPFDNCKFYPLYLYPNKTNQPELQTNNTSRTPNLDKNIIKEISRLLGMNFIPEKDGATNHYSPIDLLDYIYAVLHSMRYRDKYKEFLTTDYPRIPYPNEKACFWKLVELGRDLRNIHLLESPICDSFITTYPEGGDNAVTRSINKSDFEITDKAHNIGRVWINEDQYFDGVPVFAWESYIGGYQPAQKWLKDRKGRTLDHNDIFHYQKIILALAETRRIMDEIDKVWHP